MPKISEFQTKEEATLEKIREKNLKSLGKKSVISEKSDSEDITDFWQNFEISEFFGLTLICFY